MPAQRSVNHTHVEEDLGRVRDLVELAQRGIELIVVVLPQGRDPCLYFLYQWRASSQWRSLSKKKEYGQKTGAVPGWAACSANLPASTT